jgi:hypothetical protein
LPGSPNEYTLLVLGDRTSLEAGLEVDQRLFLVILEEFEIGELEGSDFGFQRWALAKYLIFDPLDRVVESGNTLTCSVVSSVPSDRKTRRCCDHSATRVTSC